jgi:Ca-activated chloride channel family protein
LNEGGLNRVLLLTDGLANEGITDMEELGRHAGELLVRGVATSTFGVGHGFNEHLLEHMANQGGGNFYYIDSPMAISRIFEDEFLELVSVTAKDVKVSLEIPSGVSAQVMGNWRFDLKDNHLNVWLGDISASQRREVYLKLLTPPAKDLNGQEIKGILTAISEDGNQVTIEDSLVLKYAAADEVNAAPQQKELMERFTVVQVADRTTEALILERAGERERAGHVMEQTIAMSAPYMSNELKQDYENLSRRLREGLDEGTRKSRHREEYMRKKRRDS